jgi:hypothetical protein
MRKSKDFNRRERKGEAAKVAEKFHVKRSRSLFCHASVLDACAGEALRRQYAACELLRAV